MVNYQIFAGKMFENFTDLNSKLPYFKELGISNIWITPIHKSPSYHGYDVVDYYSVKEEYGTIEDFNDMVKLYKENNIGIIIDLVICHTSDKHEWFIKAKQGMFPYVNYYHWSHKELAPQEMADNQDQSNSNLHKWTWCEERNMFYFSPFDSCMPALNLDNPQLKAEIESIVYYWTKLGIAGFRLDAVLFAMAKKSDNIAFWHWFRKIVKKYNHEAIIVGEAWTNMENASDWSNALGGVFSFDSKYSIEWHLNNHDLRGLPNRLKEINDKEKWAASIPHPFLSNHDQDRIAHSLGGDIDKLKNACAFLLTTKGIPWVYYGEEIGMTGYKYHGDEGVRQPMEWHKVWEQRIDNNSLFNLYKDLIRVRNNSNALKWGNLSPHYSDSSQCAVFLRSFYTERVYVIINNKDSSVPYIPHGEYKVLYSTNSEHENIIEYLGFSLKKGIYILQLL